MGEEAYYNAVLLSVAGEYGRIKKLGSGASAWRDVWENLGTAERGGIDPKKEWEALGEHNVELILADTPRYPPLLSEIPHPPFGLYVRGGLPARAVPCISIVGTRSATESGRETAHWFGEELARAGVCVVSGLAFGVDAASHMGALQGSGKTIAVLGSGLRNVTPRTHEHLAEKILRSGGALVSEYPIAAPALPHRFLERNRIVSGFSRGTLIIEAPERSGALATARFAVEQNRDVFVVPGPITHPNFAGSHALIQSGASLVARPGEILELLGIAPQPPKTKEQQLSESETRVLRTLKSADTPLSVDKISELTHLEAHIVNQTLSFLLVKNHIEEIEGGYSVKHS